MCGRYTLTAEPAAVARRFGLATLPPGVCGRYNIAPSQRALVIVSGRAAEGEGRCGLAMRWGLVPAWAAEGLPRRPGGRRGVRGAFINARVETVAVRPAFRSALRHRRCLVPADGFYEWRQAVDRRDPFYIRPRAGGLFAFAGLWEPGPDGEAGFAILTTAADGALRSLHDRMPVILRPEAEDGWLDPSLTDPARISRLLAVSLAGDALSLHPVSPRVNSPRHDDPGCVIPLEGPRPEDAGLGPVLRG